MIEPERGRAIAYTFDQLTIWWDDNDGVIRAIGDNPPVLNLLRQELMLPTKLDHPDAPGQIVEQDLGMRRIGSSLQLFAAAGLISNSGYGPIGINEGFEPPEGARVIE